MVLWSPRRVSFGAEVDLTTTGLVLVGTADQMLAVSVGLDDRAKPQVLLVRGLGLVQVPEVGAILASDDVRLRLLLLSLLVERISL